MKPLEELESEETRTVEAEVGVAALALRGFEGWASGLKIRVPTLSLISADPWKQNDVGALEFVFRHAVLQASPDNHNL